MPLTVRLYSRPECHLCEEMKAVAVPLVAEFGGTVEEINIDTDPSVAARYGQEIPVLFINERKAFKYRVTPQELRARLQREVKQ